MNTTALVEFLVKSIVSNPDMVKIKSFEEDEKTIIEVMVSNEDMKTVIGTNGKIANAIRTIVKSKAYANGEKKVDINFDTF